MRSCRSRRRHRRTETRALRALACTGRDPCLLHVADWAVARTEVSVVSRPLAAALGRLPARQRDVLQLYAFAGLDYDTIARSLGIPLGSGPVRPFAEVGGGRNRPGASAVGCRYTARWSEVAESMPPK